MAKRVIDSEVVLDKITQRSPLTNSGKDWLLIATDPFHDTQVRDLQGWPDVITAPSVVQVVKDSITLKTPFAAGSGNWDAHICAWPFHVPLTFTTPVFRVNNVCSWVPDTGFTLGGVQCWGTSPGGTLNYATSLSIGSSYLDPVYTQGAGRLIAMGVEVINDTASLHKQGGCYVYKLVENAELPYAMGLMKHNEESVFTIQTASTVRGPPRNVHELMLLPGSLQWGAEEGSYQTMTFHTVENPPQAASYVTPLITRSDTDDSENPEQNVDLFYVCEPVAKSGTPIPPIGNYFSAACKIDPIHLSGAIYAGLSEETTLKVNVIRYYEQFPAVSNKILLPSAHPSAEFDPMALNLYSHTMAVMPVAVKAGANPAGEWFAMVARKAAQLAATYLPMIPHPLAQAGALAAKAYVAANPSVPPPNPRIPKGKSVGTVLAKAAAPPPPGPMGMKSKATPSNPAKVRKLQAMTNKQLKEQGYTKAQISAIRNIK